MCYGFGTKSCCWITGRLAMSAGVKSLGLKLFALILIGMCEMLAEPGGGPPIYGCELVFL